MASDLQASCAVIAQRYDKDGVTIVAGPGPQPVIQLRTPHGDAVDINLQGATITSWRSAAAGEHLFLSPRAMFAEGKAIRGGIPLIFPQFGPGTLPSHGFARAMPWSVIETKVSQGSLHAALMLEANEGSLLVWPHKFQVRLEVILSSSLQLKLTVLNKDEKSFQFQWAFHTYFAVPDISKVRIPDLTNLTYLDNLQKKKACKELQELVGFTQEVDRIYCDAPDTLRILSDRETLMRITKENLPDAVLWNPWIEKSKGLTDLAPDDYRRFVCVECGAIAAPVALDCDARYTASMSLFPAS